MAKEIGRLHSFGIGAEATAGTPATIDYWLPLEEGNVKPVIEQIKDESGIGVIDEASDNHITNIKSEFTAKGIVRSKSIGTLLLGVLGTSASPVLVETGVYSHEFTRKNDNNHPSFTVIHDDATQEEQSTYNLVDSFKISAEVGSQVKFDLSMIGQGVTDTTGTTPSFVTADEPFLVSKMCVKFASNIAGLTGATPVPMITSNIEFAKNLTQIYATSSTCGEEALNFNSQHNQNFGVTGDFELVYDATTYKDLQITGNKQAMAITLFGKSLIGATKYNELTFTFASVNLEDWDRKISNNEIVNQTFGFSALYSIADTKMVSASLQNTISTQYI